jgi:hypothetical protein
MAQNFSIVRLEKMIEERGIEVELAVFHEAVNNADQIPEMQFSLASDKASRQAEMYLTPIGMVVKQKRKNLTKYIVVPDANCKFMHVKGAAIDEKEKKSVQ